MRHLFAIAPLLLFVCGAPLASAQNKVSIEDQIKADIAKRTSIKVSPIQDAGLRTCFAFEAYDVTITQKEAGGESSSAAVYVKTKTGVQNLTKPSTNADVPEMLPLIQPGFKLMSQADGVAMLSAIKALYVPKDRLGDDTNPEIVQKGTTWNFIIGKFFQKFSGFVIVTDSAGKITKVSYSLEIQK